LSIRDFATLPLIARFLVAAGWLWSSAYFVFRGRRAREARTRSEPVSVIGIALQMVAFALVWTIQRPVPPAGAPLAAGEMVLDLVAPLLSLGSAWIGLSAVSTLGKQWSFEARLIEGHQLVTRGPYAWVRHPIYTAMLGKVVACNFAFGHWLGLLLAVPIYAAGTMIRIRSEEKLLRAAFGPEYEAYARRVPAFIPWRR